MSHNKMYRSFIILQEDEKGHSITADKQVSGYAKIEVKNGKCKISFYAQNIDENKGKCNIMLISGKKDMKKIINLGGMNINAQGKGEASKEYDDTNIAGLNIGYDKITGAAICIMKGTKIGCVMCGFMNGEQPKDNWKEFEIMNKKEESPKVEEAKINKEISAEDVKIEKEYKLEEALKKDISEQEAKNQQLVQEEVAEENIAAGVGNVAGASNVASKSNIDGKDVDGKGMYAKNIDGKRCDEVEEVEGELELEEEIGVEESVKEYERVKEELEAKKRKVRAEKEKLERMLRQMEEEESEIESLENEEDDERHHKKGCKEKEYKEKDCKEKKHKCNKDDKCSKDDKCDKDDKCKEMKYEEIEIECECELKKEKGKKKKMLKHDKCCREEDDNEDLEVEYEEEILDSNYENKFDKYEEEIEYRNVEENFEVRGSVGEFFELLAEDLEVVRGKHKEIKYCKWYKVPVPTLDDMCNANNYNKYTVIYYPMINYYPYIRKYGHFVVGYKCDKNGKMKYIVYGIPGKKDKSEQPYCGKTGFVSWIKDDDMGPDMGYWLMFYDFRNSVIVVPME